MSDRDEPVLGQLPHDVQVRPHVQLAAHQHHLGVGTELLGLTLPLRITGIRTVELYVGIVSIIHLNTGLQEVLSSNLDVTGSVKSSWIYCTYTQSL